MLPAYNKPHADAMVRVKHLRNKGLVIPRPAIAARKIEQVGYERLRIYFLSRRQNTLPGKPFIPGTTYHDILKIYDFDAKLRDICFSAVGQFEILLRNSLSEALSKRYGSHPYSVPAAFRDAKAELECLTTATSIYRQSKDARALHYARCYSTPALPAIWTLKEFLTFGKCARVLTGLSAPVKADIATDFNIPTTVILESWVQVLVDLRNICAHHDRLFNRSFQKQPMHYRKAGLPSAGTPPNKLRALLQCLDYMLTQRGMKGTTEKRVEALLRRYPEISLSEVGY